MLIKSRKIRGEAEHNRIIHEEEEPRNNDTPLVIICNGNGGPYEIFHRDNYWVDFYLNFSHVCLWNYRSYGFSSGQPTYFNLKLDAEYVFKYMSTVRRYKKILCHGLSLGGIPACHLAKYKIFNMVEIRTFQFALQTETSPQ